MPGKSTAGRVGNAPAPGQGPGPHPGGDTLVPLLEANIQELAELRFSGGLGWECVSYAAILFHYRTGELACLKSAVSTFAEAPLRGPLHAALVDISLLRLAILEGNAGLIPPLQPVPLELGAAVAGEAAFVRAILQEKTGSFADSERLYRLAAEHFGECGAFRKALKARFNAIAMNSRQDPDKKVLAAEYLELARMAEAVGDRETASISLLNISSEYLRMECLGMAMEYAQQSEALLAGNDFTLQFFYGKLQLAFLTWRLGRKLEAEAYLSACAIAAFPEIRAIHRALGACMAGTPPEDCEVMAAGIPPVWRERLRAGRHGAAPACAEPLEPAFRLSALEELLIRELAGQPKDKFELIAKLYPEVADFFVAENRLKGLIHRLKKKRPGLVFLDGSRYRLAGSPARRKRGA